MIKRSPPNSDQIEVTLFGPGYGECVTVHLGKNRWIVIDSCLNTRTGKPAVLDYFSEIGIAPEKSVILIIVSHWHDDHVRGLTEVISACPEATVCCSSALTRKDFLSHVLTYQDIMTKTTSSGVNEISKILQLLKNRCSSPIKRAFANRLVLRLSDGVTDDHCTVTTLSPSDEEYENFLIEIAALIPSDKQTKIRAPLLSPNNAAVAVWIKIGDVNILLGSDLEEKKKPSSGWSAIVNSAERPKGLASVFKIPHHGSITGHHNKVWSDMVIDSPYAILSPFSLAGKILPTDNDVVRIIKYAKESYITTTRPAPKSKISRSTAVERTIRETVGKIRTLEPPMGWVSLRNRGNLDSKSWDVELSESGSKLNAYSSTRQSK
jgi:hypothetical protein